MATSFPTADIRISTLYHFKIFDQAKSIESNPKTKNEAEQMQTICVNLPTAGAVCIYA
jgi:hypothetical protein